MGPHALANKAGSVTNVVFLVLGEQGFSDLFAPLLPRWLRDIGIGFAGPEAGSSSLTCKTKVVVCDGLEVRKFFGTRPFARILEHVGFVVLVNFANFGVLRILK